MTSNDQINFGTDDKVMPIAIIGIGCRFPDDATSPEKLWDMLIRKQSARRSTPPERFNIDAFYHPDGDKNGTINNLGGHFLKEDISAFDAPFFSISSAEAISMDPMQRMLLEVVYEAMENAGTPMSKFASTNTSCYVGCFTEDYHHIGEKDMEIVPKYHTIGIGQSILSNRISFFFDLKGPSLTLDTACSSSLVAVHLACQSLRTGESKTAIVGATNAILSPDMAIGLSNLHFLSPDSTCFTFDERANGYARGEGMAALILKPLNDALRDGDTIRAVIRGTAVNSDGKTPGITLPSKDAQISLIQTAYEQSGCDPAETGYFEAHGTGTAAGDPLETGAVGATLGLHRKEGEEGKLYIGSVKTNIGHLEGASGLAGLIKAVLSVEKGVIAPNLWFEKGNPAIDFDGWKIRVPTEPVPWPSSGIRRASINSFGYGGTNGHIIIDDAYHYFQQRGLKGNHCTSVPLIKDNSDERLFFQASTQEYPKMASVGDSHLNVTDKIPEGVAISKSINSAGLITPSVQKQRPRIFYISAHEEGVVKDIARLYGKHLANRQTEHEEQLLDHLAYTLSERRSVHLLGTFVVAATKAELVQKLGEVSTTIKRSATELKLGFVFTGQGAQWWAMARELLEYPVFADSLAACDKAVQKLGSTWSVLDELLKDEKSSRVDEAVFSQPLCSAVQISLINLYASWNIHPVRVVGHSSGEIACAYAVGALSLDSAMIVAYFRGIFSSNVKKMGYNGGMLAAGLSEKDAKKEIEALGNSFGKAVVACVNSPRSVTISGDSAALTQLQNLLSFQKIFVRRLQVDTAYHSHHMLAIAKDYRQAMSDLEVVPCEKRRPVEMYSSVTGDLVTSEDDLGPDYWVKNMVSCVRFSNTLEKLCTPEIKTKRRKKVTNPVDILIELGPHSSLSGPIRQVFAQMPKQKSSPIQYLSALIRNTNAAVTALEAAASLFAQGYPVDIHTAQYPIDPKPNLSLLVDLPPYVWNHTRKYWAESRLSHNYRFRPFPRTDILGAPFQDWNPIEPRWRNFISLAEQPWMRSHVVQGAILYPAAGYCCMAIEAAAQVSAIQQRSKGSEQQTISEFKIRDLGISRALFIPQTEESIELIFSMRPNPTSSLTSSINWSEFRVFSYIAGEWAENCRGLVSVVYKTSTAEAGVYEGVDELRKDYYTRFVNAKSVSDTPIDCSKLYSGLDKAGLFYGPEFQGIVDISLGQGHATGSIQVTDTCKTMPKNFGFDRLIHPATMDTFLQVSIAALSRGDTNNLKHPYVPTSIQDLSVSGNISAQTGQMFQFAAHANPHGFREAYADTIVLEQDSLDIVVRIDGIKFMAMASSSMSDAQSEIPKHVFSAVWEPDIDLVTRENLNQILRAPLKDGTCRVRDFELLAWYFTDKLLKEVKDTEFSKMLPHHQKFFSYMQHQRDMVLIKSHEQQTDEWIRLEDADVVAKIERLIHELSDPKDYEGRMFVRMGQSLPLVLRQEIEPLALMMEDRLLYEYYAVGLGAPLTFAQISKYVSVLSHKYPDLDYLEIGAGTGGTTVPVLEALSGCDKHKYPRLKSYTYTDISSGFFEQAAEKFGDWAGIMNFRKLDIEQDPDEQGYMDQRFDVIVAANVLHATYDINRTMAHVRKLLRPGGKLVLLDMTHSLLSVSLIWGNLPGWWNCSEPERKYGPLLDETQWRDIFQRHGFTDVQASTPDYINPLEETTRVMVVTAIERRLSINGIKRLGSSGRALIIRPESLTKDGNEFVSAVKMILNQHGIPTDISSLSQLDGKSLAGTVCVSLVELEDANLPDICSSDFAVFQRLTQQSAGLLWVTRGGTAKKGTRPQFSMFQGMARSIRAEQEGFPCVTVDFDSEHKLPANHAVNLLISVYNQTFVLDNDYGVKDREFSENKGILCIKRAIEDSKLNQYVAARATSVPLQPEFQDIWQQKRPLKLEVKIGSLESFVFHDDPAMRMPIADDYVEIEIRAVGLNFKDVLISVGEVSANYLGNECSGIVTKIGSKVKSISIGDRVAAFVLGSFATKVRSHVCCVQRIPESMSFSTAAALPVVYITAYYGLIHVARLSKGESVLIHAAAGGVGQAAIQLAKIVGAEIYVTVGTEKKKKYLIDTYGIDERRVFASRDLSFAPELQHATGGRGVDVVLNSLAGEALQATWKCIAPFGRFVEIGKRDIDVNGRLEMEPFSRNITFTSVDLFVLYTQNIRLAGEMFAKGMDLVRAGDVKEPSPVVVEPFSKIEACFRQMQAGKHVGKIVLEHRAGDLVPIMPKPLESVKFTVDCSYLLAGGLGGLGRSISRWMVRNGAKNIIFVSRHGISSPEISKFIEELNAIGINTYILKCDVSDEKMLSEALTEALKSMPPIRGVIQGAMVLNDQVFSNMEYNMFIDTIRPKVQGSWSLHKATLQQPLDFFVLLSSAAEFIGNAGQSNYVAACAYQVALAAHRNSLGLPATAIDIGKVVGVGFVAENTGTVSEQNLIKMGMLDIQEDELLAILEIAMLPKDRGVSNGHMITGIHSTIDTSKEDQELPFYNRDPVFSHMDFVRPHLRASKQDKSTADTNQQPLPKLLAAATSLSEANAAALDALLRKLSRSLMMPFEEIDAHKSTGAYGVDSLIAVEIRNWLFRETKVDIPVFEILQASSLTALAEKVVAKSLLLMSDVLKNDDGVVWNL